VSTDHVNNPALDPAGVAALVDLLGDDPGALAELVEAFLEEAPLRLAELESGLGSGDAALVGRAAHTLKSNAATFGAVALEGVCRDLEALVRTGELAAAPALVGQARSEWDAVEPSLVELRDGSRSG
jgi:HPt (histidine-containing phosphotransfer) domain-containing protein